MGNSKQDQALDDISKILEQTEGIGKTLAVHGEAIVNVQKGMDKIERATNKNINILHDRINTIDRNQTITETNFENHLKRGTEIRPAVKNGNGIEKARRFWVGVMSLVLIIVIAAYVIVDKVLNK